MTYPLIFRGIWGVVTDGSEESNVAIRSVLKSQTALYLTEMDARNPALSSITMITQE